MDRPEEKPRSKEAREYSGWGALFGGIAGLLIGLFAGHGLAWGIGLGCVAWLVGGLVDRSRR